MVADESRGSQLLPVLAQLVRFLRQLDSPDNPSPVALGVLRRLDREGPSRITDLARLERTSQPGMTQLVGRLERAGLVLRTADAQDGRVVLVEVTEEGRALIARTHAYYVATLDKLFDRLDPADCETIVAALPALERLAGETAAG
ncbi:MarR family transcriptional regulator [Actinoplanes sp. NPDC051851]|uniref:MarR family winged helix-turn-helix transcriptional regulator n=1 Tax=Actinoplanes sp. NPDC051851 TaxID=3154753 RepID=UPI00343C0794